jgi:uncharacterized protein YndB with AHSA1/START domain
LPLSTDRIEKKILLRAPRERVWYALADATDFGRWFGLKFDGPFVPGASLRALIVTSSVNPEVAKAQKPHEGVSFDITIDRMEPQRLFSFRWHPHAIEPGADYSSEPTTLVEFTLEDAPKGILLTVVESGFDRIPLARRAQAFSSNEGGWSVMLQALGDYLAQAD